MPEKPQILNTEVVAHSRIFRVERLDMRFSNGEERIYERLKSRGTPAVMMVALKDPETVLLIREYSAGTDDYQLTLPKGAVDQGEDPVDAANRELMEETGHGARHIEEITQLTLAPGYMNHRIRVMYATGLYAKRLPGDEPEPIVVETHPIEDLDSLVADASFTEARALAALYIVRDRLRDGRLKVME